MIGHWFYIFYEEKQQDKVAELHIYKSAVNVKLIISLPKWPKLGKSSKTRLFPLNVNMTTLSRTLFYAYINLRAAQKQIFKFIFLVGSALSTLAVHIFIAQKLTKLNVCALLKGEQIWQKQKYKGNKFIQLIVICSAV